MPTFFCFPSSQSNRRLDEAELGGSNVESIDISGEAGESLLGAVGADEGVDLDARNVVLLLEGSGDLALVGLNIDDEDEGVVLLDLRLVNTISIYLGPAFSPSSWQTRC